MRACRVATIGVGMPAGPGSAWRRPDLNAEAPMTLKGWLRYDTITRMLPDDVHDMLEIGCGLDAFGVRFADRYNYLDLEPDPAAYAVAAGPAAALGRGEVRNVRVEVRLHGIPLCYLLDGPRDLLRKRQLADGDHTLAERTGASGRVMQPSGRHIGAITQTLTAPFRALQRGFPNLGTGLVVRARLDA